jgi:hypothetical protein
MRHFSIFLLATMPGLFSCEKGKVNSNPIVGSWKIVQVGVQAESGGSIIWNSVVDDGFWYTYRFNADGSYEYACPANAICLIPEGYEASSDSSIVFNKGSVIRKYYLPSYTELIFQNYKSNARDTSYLEKYKRVN